MDALTIQPYGVDQLTEDEKRLLNTEYQQDVAPNKLGHFSPRQRHHAGTSTWYSRSIFKAVNDNHPDDLEKLLVSGADANVSDAHLRTPLHIATSKGNIVLAQILLKFGASPNRQDAVGNTPMHLAACTSNLPLVTLLLRSGGSASLTDCGGRSPVQLAQSKLRLMQHGSGRRRANDGETDSLGDAKREIIDVIDLMAEYYSMAGCDVEPLAKMMSQVNCADDCDTISELSGVLEQMTSLRLDRNNNQSSTTATTTTPTFATSSVVRTLDFSRSRTPLTQESQHTQDKTAHSQKDYGGVTRPLIKAPTFQVPLAKDAQTSPSLQHCIVVEQRQQASISEVEREAICELRPERATLRLVCESSCMPASVTIYDTCTPLCGPGGPEFSVGAPKMAHTGDALDVADMEDDAEVPDEAMRVDVMPPPTVSARVDFAGGNASVSPRIDSPYPRHAPSPGSESLRREGRLVSEQRLHRSRHPFRASRFDADSSIIRELNDLRTVTGSGSPCFTRRCFCHSLCD